MTIKNGEIKEIEWLVYTLLPALALTSMALKLFGYSLKEYEKEPFTVIEEFKGD